MNQHDATRELQHMSLYPHSPFITLATQEALAVAQLEVYCGRT